MIRKPIAFALLASGWMLLSGQSAAPNPARPDQNVKILKDIEYAKIGDVTLKLDLFVPGKFKNPPLIVWIHGGGWEQGGKDPNLMAGLSKFGFASASIQYRLTDKAPFPAQIHDCKGAIRWLRGNAAKYGYNAERIGVAGISAGGHLSALLATSGGEKPLEGDTAGWYDQSSRIQAALDMCGPSDFILAAQDANDILSKPDSPVFKLLGGAIGDKYALAKSASPIYHLTADDAPILIFHGDKDPLVHVNQSKSLHEKYQQSGLDSSLVVIAGGGHVSKEFFDAARTSMVVAFFSKHLRPGPDQ